MTAKKIKLSLSNTQKRKNIDPLKKYYASIKSPQTRIVYTITFRDILDSITELHGTFEDKVRQFYELAKNNSDTSDLNIPPENEYMKSAVDTYVPDITKTKKLNWEPEVTIKEGFLRTIKSYL